MIWGVGKSWRCQGCPSQARWSTLGKTVSALEARVQRDELSQGGPDYSRRAFLLFFFSAFTVASWAFRFSASLLACGRKTYYWVRTKYGVKKNFEVSDAHSSKRKGQLPLYLSDLAFLPKHDLLIEVFLPFLHHHDGQAFLLALLLLCQTVFVLLQDLASRHFNWESLGKKERIREV